MAEKTPMMDIVGDLTRESLIAISYSLPDKISASPDYLEKMANGSNAVSQKNGSGMDNLRSELISLSYASPIAEPQPEAKVPGEEGRSLNLFLSVTGCSGEEHVVGFSCISFTYEKCPSIAWPNFEDA